MTPERWQRIKAALEEIEAASATERAGVVSRLCGGDAEFRQDLEPFLAADGDDDSDGGGTFFHGLIGEQAASLHQTPSARQERFGRYQLIQRIGQGGMGAVYEAVRVDDFHKKVALKIIRQGLDTDYARTRFLQERQTLAGLEHPYIARLLDGGEAEDGSPYLVMELVEGEPITEYGARLDRSARLRLFLKVCEAVEYAHRNLVVHRDLKPANILVTASGEPKLLDFGIAKLLEADGGQTQTAMLALTPDYASPEQVRGEAITTASDVYSLGIILYQLLTERRPYTIGSGTLVEMDRVICQQQPDAPGLGDELDQILLMALRKEPARRYGSVREFADDIQRLMEHRPVTARRDTLAYRVGKFLRRNRTGVAAGVLLLVGLTAAMVVTIRAERRAQARFEDVRKLATSFLVEFDRNIRQLPGSTAARELLVSTGLQHLDRLSQDAARDPKLMFDLAGAYAAFADVEGMPGLPNLGHTDRAEQSYRKSCELTDRLMAVDSSPASPYRTRATFSYSRLGYLLWRMGRVADAKVVIVKAAGLIEPKVSSAGATADDYRSAANTWGYLSLVEQSGGHSRAAMDAAAKSMEFMSKYQAITPGLRARSNLARSIGVSSSAAEAVDLERALELRDRSNGIYRELFRENPNDVEVRRELASGLQFRASLLGQPNRPNLGRPEEAIASVEEAEAIFREMARLDPRNMAAKAELAMAVQIHALLEIPVNAARAEERLKESMNLLGALSAEYVGRVRDTGIVFLTLARALDAQGGGRAAEARVALDRAEVQFEKGKSGDDSGTADLRLLWGVKGEMLLRGGDARGAVALFDRSWRALAGAENGVAENVGTGYALAVAAGQLARAWERAGDGVRASEWAAKKAKLWESWRGKYPGMDARI